LGIEIGRPQILVYCDFMEGLVDEEKDLIFKTELELFSIGIIILSKETISLSVSKMKSNHEYNLKQGT
jgi:hypothetical protein